MGLALLVFFSQPMQDNHKELSVQSAHHSRTFNPRLAIPESFAIMARHKPVLLRLTL